MRLFPCVFSAAGVVFAVFVIFSYTSSLLPAVWDEGELNARCDAVFRSENIGCGFAETEGHPQFPVVLTAAGKQVLQTLNLSKHCSPLYELRFGTIVYVSFAFGLVFYRLQKEFNTETALLSVLSMMLIPRLFAHCQIAAWDAPLTASWVIVWAVRWKTKRLMPPACSVRNIVCGVAVGLTIASKFSGLAVLLPLLAFFAFRFYKERFVTVLAEVFVLTASIVFTFILFNPAIWNHPISGIAEWFSLNTHRSINIAILFFGTMFDKVHPLPWWNTAAWTAITVPLGILVFFFCGLFSLCNNKEKRSFGLVLLLHFLPLLLIRSLPGVPVHDGVRMFITAFAFLGIIAGIGAASIRQRIKNTVGVVFFIAAFTVSISNLFCYAPQWLSFYNGAVGGVSGAAYLGMEPTYWWDSFDREVIQWLNEHGATGERVAFSLGDKRSLVLNVNIHFSIHIIKPNISLEELETMGFRYYVLQRRPSAEFLHDQELVKRQMPVFVKTLPFSKTPLLEIYNLSSSDSGINCRTWRRNHIVNGKSSTVPHASETKE